MAERDENANSRSSPGSPGEPSDRREKKPRHRLVRTLVVLALLVPVGAGAIFMLPADYRPVVVVGDSAPSPAATTVDRGDTDSRIGVLEGEVSDIERQQEYLLGTTIDQLRYLLGGLSVLLTVIVAIQAFLQARQDRVQHSGIEQVNQIMDVIERTLRSNALASTAIQDSATEVERTVGSIIDAARNALEREAEALADRPRHEHREIMAQLGNYARDFENFRVQYGSVDKWRDKVIFSPRAVYVRGLAAHYANRPTDAQNYLQVAIQEDEQRTDSDPSRRKRQRLAYYYLGLTSSNFGDRVQAASYLQTAVELDPGKTDFLTRIAAAEALALANDARAFAAAQDIIDTIQGMPGGVPPEYRRHCSRAVLIQANVLIQGGQRDYREKVRGLLEEVRQQDRDYYFATVTLAQVTDDPVEARRLYTEACEDIRDSDDLARTTEVRSLILLRMTYALALKHGPGDRHAEHQLSRALQLRSSLPKSGNNVCTVFSVLSKRNVLEDRIALHVNDIRNGVTILAGPAETPDGIAPAVPTQAR